MYSEKDQNLIYFLPPLHPSSGGNIWMYNPASCFIAFSGNLPCIPLQRDTHTDCQASRISYHLCKLKEWFPSCLNTNDLDPLSWLVIIIESLKTHDKLKMKVAALTKFLIILHDLPFADFKLDFWCVIIFFHLCWSFLLSISGTVEIT